MAIEPCRLIARLNAGADTTALETDGMRAILRHLARTMFFVLALPAGSALGAGDVEKGEAAFRKYCAQCHIPLPGDPLAAPKLNGVVGRPIAAAPNYRYSDPFLARKAEGMIWTEENLREFIRGPREFIPGTVMQFVGIKRGSMRDDLIAYLKSID
jgi:cytochrome c